MRSSLTVIALLTVVGAAPLLAQASPHDAVVLVHGRGQTGGSWVQFVPQLQGEFAVPVYAPSLGTGASWSSQSSALHAALAGRSSAFSVSHSNGGPVTRHYLRTFGAGTRVNSHFSMGSPHLGAPIAGRALDGDVSLWLGGMVAGLSSTINFYLANDTTWNGQLNPTLATVLGIVLDAITVTSAGLAVMGYYDSNSEPVLHDLRPSSANVAALAAPSFAAIEASAFGSRISLVTELSATLQPYSLTMSTSDALLAQSAVLVMANIAWNLFNDYLYHADPILQSNAWRWGVIAAELADVQLTWQIFIGAAVTGKGGGYIIKKSDGVIPWDRSSYAGAQLISLSRTVYGDIPHVMQQYN